MVFRLAGSGRMDVHGIDIEFVCHQPGQILSGDQASQLSSGKYHLPIIRFCGTGVRSRCAR